MISQLVEDMFHYFDCHFTWKLHSVFVSSNFSCSSLRIGATVKSITDSLTCQTFSRYESWLSRWKFTNGMFGRVQHSVAHSEVKAPYCRSQAVSSSPEFKNCHKVLYCYRKPKRKDKTVCQSRNKKIHKKLKQSKRKNSTKDLRLYCNVDDSN